MYAPFYTSPHDSTVHLACCESMELAGTQFRDHLVSHTGCLKVVFGQPGNHSKTSFSKRAEEACVSNQSMCSSETHCGQLGM